MKVEIGSKFILHDIQNTAFKRYVMNALTIQNPKYLDAVKMNRYTGEIAPTIRCCESIPNGLVVPRGYGHSLIRLAIEYGEPHTYDDRRRVLPEVEFEFTGTLRPYQETAVDACSKRNWGVLCAPTGSGKTCMALAVIAARKQPALIVCHTKELLNQWLGRIQEFLGIPKADIGVIGNGKRKIGEKVTVALVQTLYGCADDVANHIGFLIVDECHRCPSRTFTEAITAFDCKFMLGLSATPFRRDNLSSMIGWYLGDTLHTVEKDALIESGALCRAEVFFRATDFSTWRDASADYSRVLSDLTEDYERNRLIAQEAAQEAERAGGVVLCLSDRKGHCQELQTILSREHGLQSDVLTGNLSNGKRAVLVDRLRAGDVKILIATGALVGEGFDLPTIESLLLTTPLRFDGRLLQYVGRALRPAEGKDHARIIDFVDNRIGVLESAAKSRESLYRRTPGITIAKD